MFSFIKKLFEKEKEVIKELKPDDLSDWFADHIQSIEGEMQESIKEIKKHIKDKIAQGREAIEKLSAAQLQNPNITVREQQFMEGNRKTYMQRTEQVLREIEDLLEHEISFILANAKEYLQNFGKSTTRSYRILQNFFSNEVAAISIQLRELDETINRLSSDEKIQLGTRLKQIKNDLETLRKKIQHKQDLTKQLEELKKKAETLNQELQDLNNQEQEKTTSKEFEEYNTLREKQQTLTHKLSLHKRKLYDDFSLLDRAFKKYERIAMEHGKLVAQYSSDPYAAIQRDDSLHILDILAGIKKNIQSNTIELKEKVAPKAVQRIDSLTKEHFESFLKEESDIKQQQEETKAKLSALHINEELADLKQKKELCKEKQKRIHTEQEKLQTEYDSISLPNLREKIKEKIEHTLKMKIQFI